MPIKLIPAYIFDCPSCGKSTAESRTPLDCDTLDSQFSKELRAVLGETSAPVFLHPRAVTCVHCGAVHKTE